MNLACILHYQIFYLGEEKKLGLHKFRIMSGYDMLYNYVIHVYPVTTNEQGIILLVIIVS